MEKITKAEALFRQGCELFSEDLAGAALLFTEALVENPRHQGALVWLARCKDDPEDRRSLLERAIELDSASENGLYARHLLAALETSDQHKQENPQDPHRPTANESNSSDDPSSRSILEPGDIIGGKYEILKYLSAGGFGTTYKARDLKLKQLYVVKQLFLRNDADQKLLREVKMLVALNHPGHEGIPPIHEYLEKEQCLVMKYIEGKNLFDPQSSTAELRRSSSLPVKGFWRSLLDRWRDLSENKALHYMRDVSSALAYMHNHKEETGKIVPKIHGDVSPANLIIDQRKHIWLIDFGLTVDKPEGLGGNDDFIAPEQKEGKPEPRSDVYSLGKTFDFLTNSEDKSARLSSKFRQLIKHTTRPSASDRPTAVWIVDMLDQLLALRLARRQLFGLLIVIMLMLLLYLGMFFPELGLLPRGLNPFRNQLDASDQRVAQLTTEAQNAQKELQASEQKVTQLTTEVQNAQAELQASDQRVAQLTTEAQNAQKELQVSEQKVTQLTTEVQNAQAELQASEQRVAQLTTDVQNPQNAQATIPRSIGLVSPQDGDIKEVAFYESWSFIPPEPATFRVVCTSRPSRHSLLSDQCSILVIDSKTADIVEYNIGSAQFKSDLGTTYIIRIASGFSNKDYGTYSLKIEQVP